jgi:two-component system sensor histidine kinase/response regulator
MATLVARRSDLDVPRRAEDRIARVLLVDADPVNGQVVLELLLELGHRADVVRGGSDALAALATAGYDLVLMDCDVPGTDGRAVAAAIRRREADRSERRVPIVAMSTSSTGSGRQRCLDACMDGHLAKPFRLAQLGETLRHWLPADLTVPPRRLLDRDVVRALCGDGPRSESMREIVELFRSDGAARLEVMREALLTGDGDRMRGAAHALRGGGAMIGAIRVERICAKLEEECRSGDMLALRALVERLEDVLASTAQALGEIVAQR